MGVRQPRQTAYAKNQKAGDERFHDTLFREAESPPDLRATIFEHTGSDFGKRSGRCLRLVPANVARSSKAPAQSSMLRRRS